MPYMVIHCSTPNSNKTVYIPAPIVDIRTISFCTCLNLQCIHVCPLLAHEGYKYCALEHKMFVFVICSLEYCNKWSCYKAWEWYTCHRQFEYYCSHKVCSIFVFQATLIHSKVESGVYEHAQSLHALRMIIGWKLQAGIK